MRRLLKIHMHGKLSVIALAVITSSVLAWWYRRRFVSRTLKQRAMKLYWYDSFRSKRCEWLLAELGTLNDVEFICMNPKDPDQEKLAHYRKVHPHGTIPCLEVEGRQAIIESGAICLYLADVYGRLGPEQDKEAYYNWLVYSVTTLDETMEALYVQWVLTDFKEQDNELVDKMVLKFQTFAKYLSKYLEDRDYICGNKLTAADCVLGYNIWWASSMRDGVLLKDFPVILDYYSRLNRRSTFQRVFNETAE